MTYSTTSDVEALLGFSFSTATVPTTIQVSGTLIPMADRYVDNLNLSSLNANDKTDLSALWAAHLVVISKDVDFKTGDITVSASRIPTHFAKLFELTAQVKGKGMHWKTVNPL